MKASDIIKTRRAELNLTLEDIGKYVGVGKSTVKKWESGQIENMRRDKIALLANILQVDPAVFITDEDSAIEKDLLSQHPEIFRPKMRKVPLLGKVACGQPIYSPSFDDGFALINDDIPADFALIAKGDSMTGVGIRDGDVVFFREQDMVDNGQIAAVFVDDEVTLKRVVYYREKNKLILYSENPTFEPLVYIGEELDHIHIIGRAVAHLRKL